MLVIQFMENLKLFHVTKSETIVKDALHFSLHCEMMKYCSCSSLFLVE